MKKLSLAIVGASGLVGQSILEILKEENLLESFDITLFVSDKSAGKSISLNGKNLIYKLLDEKSAKSHFDIALLSAGDDVSKQFAEHFATAGAYVIDNSNAFRRKEDVPLVVPEINASAIKKENKIIANPNCSTIELVIVLEKLKKLSKIEKVVVSTYQAVSGAGHEALSDLENGSRNQISEGIKNNVVAHIGEFSAFGFCTEEDKMMFETNKILNENISLCATTVRVPVPNCHSESVYIKFAYPVLAQMVSDELKCEYINVLSDVVSLPTQCSGTNVTSVCRIRNFSENEVAFFIVADNLRRGASYNAVKIMEYVIDNFIKNN